MKDNSSFSPPPLFPLASDVCLECGLVLSEKIPCYCMIKADLADMQVKEESQIEENQKAKIEKWYQFLLEQGHYWLDQSHLDLSRAYLFKALSLCPDRPEATQMLQKGEEKIRESHYHRLVQEGEVLFKEGNLGGAKAKWETALIFQKSEEVQKKLDRLYEKLNQEEFMLCKEEALRFYEAGAYREALECLEKALAIQEEKNLRQIYLQVEEILEKVHQCLKEADEYGIKGQWKEALQLMEEGFKLYPEDHELLMTTALLSAHRDEYYNKMEEAGKAWKTFHFWKALQIYHELLSLCPEDKRLQIRVFLLFLQIFLGFFLVSYFLICLYKNWKMF